MNDEIITLIDEIDAETEERLDVFATIWGIGQKEFFAAAQEGFKPDFKITIWQSDYDGQAIVELNNRRYSVYRTYPLTDGHIELYLTSKVGVCYEK